MKLILIVLGLAAFPAGAADPQLFAPEPFLLGPAPPAQSDARDFHDDILTYLQPTRPLEPIRVDYGIRVDLPIGPIRTDYGLPLKHFNFNVDSPGPGYRELRDKKQIEGRNS
jgi:hypothetical protein